MYKTYVGSNDKEYKYHRYYMDLAIRTSYMSYARRKKVGACFVTNNNIVFGWNGMPTGWDNNCEYEENGVLVTRPECLHAEQNIIKKLAKLGSGQNKGDLYITLAPCVVCANLIHEFVNNVYFTEVYRKTDGLELLESFGVNNFMML